MSRGKSINTDPETVEKDSEVPSFDSKSSVGRHTEDLRQTDSSHQSVLGAPAPGIPVVKAASFSPEHSRLILPSSDQIGLKNSKDPPDFPNYQVLITNGYISRTELWKKMDEDLVLKVTDSGIFYKDYCNKKNSLKYLTYKLNQCQDIKNYKYINLEEEKNEIFNRFFNDLDKDTEKRLKSKEQLAFIRFRKKDGSFDMDKKVYKKSDLPKEEHTEDRMFEQLLDIYEEDDSCYSEIYIFSTNSPCGARHNHVPCMIQAVFIAKLLYEKHGIKTVIGYLKPWGFSGSYEKHLPEYSIKDFIDHFPKECQKINNSPQTPTNKQVDTELLIQVYKQIIPEVKNKKFLMKDERSTKKKIKEMKHDLKRFYSEISKPEFKKKVTENLHNILSELYEVENLKKTFDDFKKQGLDMFKKSVEENDFLKQYADIYEEIHKYLKNDFFPWWDKQVEDAFSKFLKKETSWFLQESAVCLLLRDITETKDFLDIGNVIVKNLII